MDNGRVDKLCQKCGKRMIQQFDDIVLCSYPPQYPWHWWCGCGNTERGGILRGKTQEQFARESWEEANQ